MPDTYGTPSTGFPPMGFISINPIPSPKEQEGLRDMPHNTGARRENKIEIPSPTLPLK